MKWCIGCNTLEKRCLSLVFFQVHIKLLEFFCFQLLSNIGVDIHSRGYVLVSQCVLNHLDVYSSFTHTSCKFVSGHKKQATSYKAACDFHNSKCNKSEFIVLNCRPLIKVLLFSRPTADDNSVEALVLCLIEFYALLNFSLPCLQRGHFQSSGKSSKATPSCSAGSYT